MIACDICEEWFHAACFGINLMEIVDIANFPFTCSSCKSKARIADDDSECDLLATEQLKLKQGTLKRPEQRSVLFNNPSKLSPIVKSSRIISTGKETVVQFHSDTNVVLEMRRPVKEKEELGY